MQSAGRPVVYDELAWLPREGEEGDAHKPQTRVELSTEPLYAEVPPHSRPRAELPTGRSHAEPDA
jgi:hypothetical protein